MQYRTEIELEAKLEYSTEKEGECVHNKSLRPGKLAYLSPKISFLTQYHQVGNVLLLSSSFALYQLQYKCQKTTEVPESLGMC